MLTGLYLFGIPTGMIPLHYQALTEIRPKPDLWNDKPHPIAAVAHAQAIHHVIMVLTMSSPCPAHLTSDMLEKSLSGLLLSLHDVLISLDVQPRSQRF